MIQLRTLVYWLCLGVLAACGGCGGGGAADGQGGDAGLLAGDAQARALAVLPSVAPLRASPGDITAGGELLTRLSVVLKLDATVGDVNAAARAVGASAFGLARPNSPFITMVVPRQVDARALDALAAQLRGRTGIVHAAAARQLRPQELPNAGGQTADVSEVDYLLATRFPAAWNARRAAEANCSTRKVTLIVPDFFFGSPSAFASQTEGAVTFEGVPLEPLAGQVGDSHGYEVIGTLAAKFDALLSHGANPSPSCLQIHTIDAAGLDAAQLIDQLASAIAAESGPVIVSSSVGYKVHDNTVLCPDGCSELAADFEANARQFVAEAFLDGIHWASFAMQPSFVDRVLIVQAAGNDADQQPGLSYPGFSDAKLNSPIAIGSELSDLEAIANDATRWAPPGLPSLVLDAGVVQTLKDLRDALVPAAPTARNLAIVGSAINQPLLADLQRSSFSNLGADLFAVGDDVSTIDLLVKDGTSFSAPQAAGLASMLWLLDPDLRAQPVEQTLALIRATAASNARLGGVIDAYAAVLAIDARRQRLDVRKALLDVNGDGVFDHLDLQAFVHAYVAAPTARDYSRHDLNGDGSTGGIGTERFALQPGAVGAAPAGNVTLTIEGYEINMNQAALSDLQILCYYAYATDTSGSPLLYDSRTEAITERTNILGPERCVQARIVSTFGGAIAGATPLAATVQVPSAGSFSPAPNVRVEASATCGSVTPAVSTTDANGQVALTAAPGSGCTSIDVTLVARASAGTVALATQTFSASVSASSSSARGTRRDAIVEAEFGGNVFPDDPVPSAPFNPLPLEGHWLGDGSLGAFSTVNLTQKDAGAYVVGNWSANASVAETTVMSADGSNLSALGFDARASCSLSRPSDYAVCDSRRSVTPCVSEGAAARQADYTMNFDVIGAPMTAHLTGEITVTRGPTAVQFPTVALDRREAQVTLRLGAIALPSFIQRKGQTIDGAAGAADIQSIDATVVLAPGSYSIDAKTLAVCTAVDNATAHFARVRLSLSLTP